MPLTCDCQKRIDALQKQIDGLEAIVKAHFSQMRRRVTLPVGANRAKVFDECVGRVCSETLISESDLFSVSRRWPIAHARQRLMAYCYRGGMGPSEISRALGVDPSTVIYGIAAHEAREN